MKSRSMAIGAERVFVLVLDQGEDAFKAITEFADKEGISGASVSAIGAFERAKVGWFDLVAKAYRPIAVDEQAEVLSLMGDVNAGLYLACRPRNCGLPASGTEVVFEETVYAGGLLFRKNIYRLARFRQINTDNTTQHHDALEFANGRTVLVTDLVAGQTAKILQLPVSRSEKSDVPVSAPPVPA